jgi:histidinol-phosphate/aromatic aminotransferase/cobyric acid decarboxylase-like protein
MSTLPSPGPHGGDGPAIAAWLGVDPAEVLDLSQSLNPVAPDLRPLAAAHLDAIGRYPDPSRATVALAEAMGIDCDRLVLANGGAEAIALVANRLGRGWVDEPDFALYRRHLPVLDPDGARFRSNPHSPTGRLAGPDEHADVWDEAFFPLATGTWTRGDNAWVVGSLTKLLACPGLRLGYVLAPDPEAASAIRARQPQWSVSSLATEVLPEALTLVDLPTWRDQVTGLRTQLVGAFAAHGLAAEAADGCWVLVHDPALRDRLAPEGIAVRDCTTFGLPGVHRVGVPDGAGLDRLAQALERTA